MECLLALLNNNKKKLRFSKTDLLKAIAYFPLSVHGKRERKKKAIMKCNDKTNMKKTMGLSLGGEQSVKL